MNVFLVMFLIGFPFFFCLGLYYIFREFFSSSKLDDSGNESDIDLSIPVHAKEILELPILNGQDSWFLTKDKQEYLGPFSLEEVSEKIENGLPYLEWYAFKKGMKKYQLIGDLPEFQSPIQKANERPLTKEKSQKPQSSYGDGKALEQKMENKWFVLKSGIATGPYGETELQEMATNGLLLPSDRLRDSDTGKVIQAVVIGALGWNESLQENLKDRVNLNDFIQIQKNLNEEGALNSAKPYLGPTPPPVPPPVPQEYWFIHQNGNRFGPISRQDFEKLVSANQISMDALAWKEGLVSWIPVSKV